MNKVTKLREWAARAKPVAAKLAPLALRALWDVGMLVMLLQDGNMVDPAIKLPRQTERAIRSVRALWEAIVEVLETAQGRSR